jgi:uncharacterized protein YdeI (BOF family)
MKAMSKILILATISFCSAGAFAADSVGQHTDTKDCVQNATQVQKAQDNKAAAVSDDAKKDAKAGEAK